MKIVNLLEKKEGKERKFLEILFDERIAEGIFWAPKEKLQQAGGVNCRVKAKQQYELLLRLADSYFLDIKECFAETDIPKDYVKIEGKKDGFEWDGICTDCYIIAKYKDILLKYNCFNEAAESVLAYAKERGMQNEAAALLEKMIKREAEYNRIEDGIRPVLIYKGADICYNMLNIFAEQLGGALVRMGCPVEYFDSEKKDIAALAEYRGRRYRAIVGIQTYLFCITTNNGQMYLHDLIFAPKFNFLFDHPVWMKRQMGRTPDTVSVLTLDSDYREFIRRYYGKKAYVLPPAGILPEDGKIYEKKYDVTFIGSFIDYREELRLIHGMDRDIRFLANRFLMIMRKNPNLTSEEAFFRTLDFYGISCSDEEFLELFYQVRIVNNCVMHYYRYLVIKTLADAGIRVDVFGSGFLGCPLCRRKNFTVHPDVSLEESMQVWRQSKLSLNIMSWHKSGFTERMANIMLCKAALVTDDTRYLDGRFCDGADLIAFRLDRLDLLPERILDCLNDSGKLEKIACSGFEKAKENHTWDRRAKEFLEEILEGGGRE